MATKPSLALIPSAYNTSKVYSVLPTNGDGDFDFSREGVSGVPNATRINKDGLIETVGANIPRLDYSNGGCPSLLLEPQRTNYITYSEDFSQWTGAGYTTANYAISPDGTKNASRCLFTGSDQFISFLTTATGNVTGSIYIKGIAGETIQTSVSSFQDELFTLSGEWQRISTTATTTNGNFNVNTFGSVTARDFLIFAAQYEVGSYASSYIPTLSGSIATRYNDECNRTSIQEYIGQTEGTLFLDFEYLYETTTDSSTDGLRDITVLGTASNTSEGISIDNYRSQFRVFVQGSGMTTQSIGSGSTGSAQPNTRYKLAVKYKTGDCKAYLNGSLLRSSTGTVNFATDLDGIFFSFNSSSLPYKNQKKVYKTMIFNEALTDQELIELTTI